MTARRGTLGGSLERIRAEIDVDPQRGCWLWRRGTTTNGYAEVRISSMRTMVYVHRLLYTILLGPIPDGLELDHLCRTTRCVRPDHLEPVTHAENVRRNWFATKTHCVHGHGFTPENTGRRRSGHRFCRTCVRAKKRAAYYRARDAAREEFQGAGA